MPFSPGREISVKRIITKIAADFKRDAEEILTGCRKGHPGSEDFFVPRIGEMIAEILTAIYEAAEQKLLEDRNRRWQAGQFWQRAAAPWTHKKTQHLQN